MARRRMRFARQVLLLQVGVVVLVIAVGFALVGWLLRAELYTQFGQRALSVARSVAAQPGLADAVAADDPEHIVQARAEAVRTATGALFVVVTDDRGIRLSHPNPAQIGQRVSTDPSAALAGREVVTVERGTLGLSARGKVPLRAADGRVVGEVSVGFPVGVIFDRLVSALVVAGGFAAGALLLGVLASVALSSRLRAQTLGLEPHELADLVREREAVLHGVGEGVVAVDPAGRVSVCNDEAARLLDGPATPGTPVAELDVPAGIREVLAGTGAARNLQLPAGSRVLVVNRRAVRRDGRDLGAVITLRDRTDLEALTRELDAVRALTDALRAQGHEYRSRLHTLSGLLQLGHHEEAVEYLQALAEDRAGTAALGADSIADHFLQGLLAAKAAVAAEKRVRLDLGDGSWVSGRVVAPLAVTTVLGNLIDNAIEAARVGARRPALVEVELLDDGPALHLTVADSGDGVPAELADRIFADGMSTRDDSDGPRGMGLTLARQAARARGGEVRLADSGDDRRGAVFVAQLPGVLAPAEPAEAAEPAEPAEPGEPGEPAESGGPAQPAGVGG
jgi:two-component system, CitB family, sensor kinase